MKKILSLILALTFIITTFAFVGTTVYADTSLIYDTNFPVGADNNHTGTYYGRSDVLHITRAANKNTFFSIKLRTSAHDSDIYQVYELSVIFGDNIDKFSIRPADKEGTTYYLANFSDVVKEDDWNDLKIILTNKAGTTGRTYLNGKYIGELTIGTAATGSSSEASGQIRIRFENSAATADITEEMWIDKNSIKGTAKILEITPDGYAYFNPEASQNGMLIVAAYNSDGTVAKVNTKSVSTSDTLISGFTGAYNYKAFLFNSLTDIKPLVGSVSVK